MFRVVRALVLALLIAGLASPPAAQAAGDEWRLLFSDGALRDGTGALKSKIPVLIDDAGRFSPDGTRLAVPAPSFCGETCEAGEGAVAIHSPDGGSVVRGSIPSFSTNAVTWSPDGSTVAVLGYWSTPEDDDVRIYLIPVGGGSPTLVFSETRALRPFLFGGLSWNPADNTLAFIATEFLEEDVDQGVQLVRFENTDQVWTVPAAASATPERYTGRPSCQFCADFPYFNEPQWSPDGSRLAVRSTGPHAEPGQAIEPFVGVLAAGALEATELAPSRSDGPLAWSSDGSHLGFGIEDVSGDYYEDTKVVDAATGDVTAVFEDQIPRLVDWLPCPGGSCQIWQDVYEPPKPSIAVTGRAKRAKVVVTGEMFRVPEETTVTVTLARRRKAGRPWQTVTTVQVNAEEGLFRRTFARPDAVRCRVKATYIGDVYTVSDVAVFDC